MRYETVQTKPNQLSVYQYIMLSTGFQFLVTAAAAGIMGRCIFSHPKPAYPPKARGDGGAVPFLFTVGVLGAITAFIGGLSACNRFNRLANQGSKRRFFRYTSPCVDVIFAILAGGALAVSRHTPTLGFPLHSPCLFMARLTSGVLQLAIINLDAGHTDCLANMDTYQGCALLMAAIVMVCLGGLMTSICFCMEVCCLMKRK